MPGQIHVYPVIPKFRINCLSASSENVRISTSDEYTRSTVLVHAVVIMQRDREADPVHMQALQPFDIVRRDERARPPGGFPLVHNIAGVSIISRNRDGAQRKIHPIHGQGHAFAKLAGKDQKV